MIAKTGFPEYLEAIAIGPDPDFLKKQPDLCELANKFEAEVGLTYLWKQVERSRDTVGAVRNFTKNFMLNATELDTDFLMHYVKKMDRIDPEVRDKVKLETRQALVAASTITQHVSSQVVAAKITKFDNTKPLHEDDSFLNRLSNLLDACDAPCDYFEPISDKIGSLIDYSRHNSLGNASVGDFDQNAPPPMGIGLNVLNKIPSVLQETLAAAYTSAKLVIDTTLSILTNPGNKHDFTKMSKEGRSPDQSGVNFTGATSHSLFHEIMGMHTNMRAKIKNKMQDCYRSAEFMNRYNPFNPDMNLAMAQENYYDIVLKSATGERPYSIRSTGQAKYISQNNHTTLTALTQTNSMEARMFDDNRVAPRPKPRTTPQVPGMNPCNHPLKPVVPPPANPSGPQDPAGPLTNGMESNPTPGTSGDPAPVGKPGGNYQTNDASKAILKAAFHNIGRNTAVIPNTQQGNVACAASVNLIVREALGYEAGGGLATAMMYPALRKNTAQWKEVSPDSAVPGSIIISPTAGGKTGHVGILADTSGGIISNSSKNRQIMKNYTISSWNARYVSKLGLKTYAFTHVGPVNSSVQESLAVGNQSTLQPVVGVAGSLPCNQAAVSNSTSDASGTYNRAYPTGVSQRCVDFIKKFEGFNAVAFWDYKQWTVGYGTRASGKGETITKQEAETRLAQEIQVHASKVDSLAKKRGMILTAGQRDALISYDYNSGRSHEIFQAANNDASKISNAIANGVNRAGGKVLNGLVDRRRAEAQLAASV